jgi:hypothetical protein
MTHAMHIATIWIVNVIEERCFVWQLSGGSKSLCKHDLLELALEIGVTWRRSGAAGTRFSQECASHLQVNPTENTCSGRKNTFC